MVVTFSGVGRRCVHSVILIGNTTPTVRLNGGTNSVVKGEELGGITIQSCISLDRDYRALLSPPGLPVIRKKQRGHSLDQNMSVGGIR